jgi:hypothetical protein
MGRERGRRAGPGLARAGTASVRRVRGSRSRARHVALQRGPSGPGDRAIRPVQDLEDGSRAASQRRRLPAAAAPPRASARARTNYRGPEQGACRRAITGGGARARAPRGAAARSAHAARGPRAALRRTQALRARPAGPPAGRMAGDSLVRPSRIRDTVVAPAGRMAPAGTVWIAGMVAARDRPADGRRGEGMPTSLPHRLW